MPICEVACPFDSCSDAAKLAAMKQTDFSAPPKFNPFNFKRHVTKQHLNRKRKSREETFAYGADSNVYLPPKRLTFAETVLDVVDCDQSVEKTDSFREFQDQTAISSTPIHPPVTPKTSTILKLQNELNRANEIIKAMKTVTSTTTVSSSATTPKSARIEKLSTDLSVVKKMADEFKNENIMLRHKCMDASGKIQTFCRVNHNFSGDCFKWNRTTDGSQLRLCMFH